jgi:multisubunit Na+/H+ antiporter MnhF subunit
VIVAGVALAVLTSWPLILHMPSRIAPDLGDPVRTAWQVAYVGHAMLHDPLHLFDANVFYPHPLSLAFSDSLLGYGPAGFFGSGTVAALVRYNVLFLFAWSLCFVGGYLLARELGLRKLGAAAAAAAFAYAPYRVTEAGHLHVISSGGIALALFLLLRGYRRGSVGLLIAGWLVSAWQISLGFTLGLQFSYLLAVLTVIAAIYWLMAGRPTLPRRLVVVTCLGILVVGVVAIYEARPYLKISHDYPTAKRTIKEVKNYSAGPAAWLSASSENRVWGDLTAGARAHVHSKNEQVLFPGGFILLLALIGLAAPLYTRRLRIGLAAGVVVCAVLALGLGLTGYGYPYRLLFNYAPGWDGVRVPGRVFTLATLFLALLAGAGAQLLAGKLGEFSSRHTGRWGARRSLGTLTAVVGVVIVIGVVGEGAGHMAHPVVPQPKKAEIGLPGPLLDMPTDGPADRVWQYYSTNGFYKTPIGNSTFDIPAVDDLRGGINRFPDKASVEKLRYYGIRTVVLHLTMPKLPGIVGYAHAEPPDSAAAAAKPIAGLGMTRRRVGSLVIYEIGPGPKALHGHD